MLCVHACLRQGRLARVQSRRREYSLSREFEIKAIKKELKLDSIKKEIQSIGIGTSIVLQTPIPSAHLKHFIESIHFAAFIKGRVSLLAFIAIFPINDVFPVPV